MVINFREYRIFYFVFLAKLIIPINLNLIKFSPNVYSTEAKTAVDGPDGSQFYKINGVITVSINFQLITYTLFPDYYVFTRYSSNELNMTRLLIDSFFIRPNGS